MSGKGKMMVVTSLRLAAVAQDCYVEQTEAFSSMFQNKSKYQAIASALAEMLYREFNR